MTVLTYFFIAVVAFGLLVFEVDDALTIWICTGH